MTRWVTNYLDQQVQTSVRPMKARGPYLYFADGTRCDVQQRNNGDNSDIQFVGTRDSRYVPPGTASTEAVWVVNFSNDTPVPVMTSDRGTVVPLPEGAFSIMMSPPRIPVPPASMRPAGRTIRR